MAGFQTFDRGRISPFADSSVANQWRRKGHQQNLALHDFQQLYSGEFKLPDIEKQWRRGAPRKRLGNREDVKRVVKLQGIADRLSDGIRLKNARKAQGGYTSGDEQIRPGLLLKYTELEANAILSERTLEGAAKCVLLASLDTPVSRGTLDASIRRGKQLLARARKPTEH